MPVSFHTCQSPDELARARALTQNIVHMLQGPAWLSSQLLEHPPPKRRESRRLQIKGCWADCPAG
eukprot:603081-Alexandrium_andersonii.AAC.1